MPFTASIGFDIKSSKEMHNSLDNLVYSGEMLYNSFKESFRKQRSQDFMRMELESIMTS
jgi:hypothetical protein